MKGNMEGNIRKMEVSDPWVGHIFSGVKKVEMRKNDPNNWGKIANGDKIWIVRKGTDEKKLFQVIQKREYKSLQDCFMMEGIRQLLPGVLTLESALDVYLSFDGTGNDARAKRRAEFDNFGCLALELKEVHNRVNIDKALQTHVTGSSSPLGDPNCKHEETIVYNDDTMGGCGSTWEKMCESCGKVWN